MLDAPEPEAAAFERVLALRDRLQPDAVVRNGDRDLVVLTEAARELDDRRLRVLADVGEELAQRAEDDLADTGLELDVGRNDLELAVDAAAGLELLAELVEPARERQRLRSVAHQIADDLLHVVDRGLGEIADLGRTNGLNRALAP